jgi:hypothetical protein
MHWPKTIKAMRLRARLRKFVRTWRKILRTHSLPEPSSDPLELAFSAFKVLWRNPPDCKQSRRASGKNARAGAQGFVMTRRLQTRGSPLETNIESVPATEAVKTPEIPDRKAHALLGCWPYTPNSHPQRPSPMPQQPAKRNSPSIARRRAVATKRRHHRHHYGWNCGSPYGWRHYHDHILCRSGGPTHSRTCPR